MWRPRSCSCAAAPRAASPASSFRSIRGIPPVSDGRLNHAKLHVEETMAFCDHCEGQRFDRAQVLRALRTMRNQMRNAKTPGDAEQIIAVAIETVRALEIPHFDWF